MSSVESDVCGNCRFWYLQPEQRQGTVRNGLCRRYPPTMHPVGYGMPSVIADPSKQAPMPLFQGLFPTMSEFGWCGEHQPATAEPHQTRVSIPHGQTTQ